MKLSWLNQAPAEKTGITWGVPWSKGTLARTESLKLEETRLQSWPMAFWPDGSVKWTGHAALLNSEMETNLVISKGDNLEPRDNLKIDEFENYFIIDTGVMKTIINKSGNKIIDEIIQNNYVISSHAKIKLVLEQVSEKNDIKNIKQTSVFGKIEDVSIERTGNIYAVLKVKGSHSGQFPFTLRFSFFAGSSQIKIIHSFYYDDKGEDVNVKGIGLSFGVNVAGELWNRQIRVATETGFYNENSKLFLSRRHRKPQAFKHQISGKMVSRHEIETLESGNSLKIESWNNDTSVFGNSDGNAIWNDFKLVQSSAQGYKFSKRTNKNCSWVNAFNGFVARGVIYAGGENGGIAVGLKDFWQKYPASFDVLGLGNDNSEMIIWLWSPDSEAMDMRHYSETTHVKSAYEGFDEMRATPIGIANTSEIYLKVFHDVASNEVLEDFTRTVQEPPLLICEPTYYHETQSLGVWSLPNRDTKIGNFLENQLDACLQFYLNEVKQRNWYGYWNYGDFMHTYDSVRNQWYYDMGGYAWHNTELVPNIWLWYSFLRTGRSDIFRLAEAMTRHTSEVDRYHFGEYEGLGSRHNVSHWGCGCKEARIAMAGLHKYYYFLTADERTRELLESVKDADFAMDRLDPMREFYSDDQHKTHARVGPDWSAFCSNWLSEWERTEDKNYLNKIKMGLQNLKDAPYGLLSGPTYGYNTETSELIYMGTGNSGGHHMIIAFGAPQVWMEMAELIADSDFKKMIADFGRFYLLSNDEKLAYSEGKLSDAHCNWPMFAASMCAYAANYFDDELIAEKAWDLLLNDSFSGMKLPFTVTKVNNWKNLQEVEWITTNVISQWCLNVIVCLELIGYKLKDLDYSF